MKFFSNLTSNWMRASCICTCEKSAKYCQLLFIYGVFKPYFDKKIFVYVCVVFKLKLVSFY